ncbi:MAG TPA: hypothetical protein VK447_20840 [Myxococcaceae bacterium]|nr:hypothetical protein [Myxococcaceae bacterium]
MAADKPKTRSLTRAASLGLAMGVALAGILLMVLALRTLNVEVNCSGPEENECLFQHQIDQQLARWQLYIGLGLELLAVGSLLWIRANDRKAARPPDATP